MRKATPTPTPKYPYPHARYGYLRVGVLGSEKTCCLELGTYKLEGNKPLTLELCHCLSMRLNCLTGLINGIASIAKKLLTTCMFPLSIPLCLVFPYSIHLALGQRRSRLFPLSHIIVSPFNTLDGPPLIVSVHRCPGLLLAMVQPSSIVLEPLFFCYPCWYRPIVLIVHMCYLPSLGVQL